MGFDPIADNPFSHKPSVNACKYAALCFNSRLRRSIIIATGLEQPLVLAGN